MDLCHMTRQEIEALLKMLAEMEREELVLLMQERPKMIRRGGCTNNQTPHAWRGFSSNSILTSAVTG